MATDYQPAGPEAYRPVPPEDVRGRYERSRGRRDSAVAKTVAATAFGGRPKLTDDEKAEYAHVCDFVANTYVGRGEVDKFAEVCRGCETYRGERDPDPEVILEQ